MVINPEKVIVEGIKTVASAYPLDVDDFIILASGDTELTLPAITVARGCHFVVKKTDTDAKTITITPQDSMKIDGASSLTLTEQYNAIALVSDGLNWYKIAIAG